MIKTQTYSLNNLILNKDILSIYINNFWLDVFKAITQSKDMHLLLMCKVEYAGSGEGQEVGYRSLGYLRSVNYSDKDLFIDYNVQKLSLLTEAYTITPISKITFTYVIKPGLAVDNRRLLEDVSSNPVSTHRFHNLNLPLSMNPEDYGIVTLDNYIQKEGKSYHRFIVSAGDQIFSPSRSSNEEARGGLIILLIKLTNLKRDY